MGGWRINSVETSFFGRGCIALLKEELNKRKYHRALIVTDQYLYEQKVADRVGEELLKADLEYAVYYLVAPNPTVEIVEECVRAAKTLEVDVLVAVGGGSPIDTAKAASIVITNGGKIEDYEGVNRSSVKGLPIIAVNTTAGTGSEVTSFYIITDPKKNSKLCMVDTNCMVEIAINDIDFMMTMPGYLTATTGMDALTHAIEAVLSRNATPLTDKDALFAITTIKEYLEKAVINSNDEKAREMMAYAQYSAGMAFSNAGLGMVHAMAHALGGLYNLPHGLCNAVLLPHVLEYNGESEEVGVRCIQIAKAFGIKEASGLNPLSAIEICISYIKDLSKRVEIPEYLSAKTTKEDYVKLANLALEDTCMKDNILRPKAEDIEAIYKKVIPA